ncbi:MAG: TetR/AcrR family transcriptional regulator [Acetobacteraceae bacterium]|nr:TetR/AcrR family transcriptional regulator [Acetobacteraceae bacterium]
MRLDRATRRELIVRAAAAAFSEHGYRGASIRDIARRAQVSEALIYRHFATKEDLFRAASQASPPARSSVWPVPGALARAGGEVEFLERTAQDLLSAPVGSPGWLRALLYAVLEAPGQAGRMRDAVLGPRVQAVVQCLGRGVGAGRVREELDLELAARAFVGMVAWAGLELQLEGGADAADRPERDRLARGLVDLFLKGVRAGPAGAAGGGAR